MGERRSPLHQILLFSLFLLTVAAGPALLAGLLIDTYRKKLLTSRSISAKILDGSRRTADATKNIPCAPEKGGGQKQTHTGQEEGAPGVVCPRNGKRLFVGSGPIARPRERYAGSARPITGVIQIGEPKGDTGHQAALRLRSVSTAASMGVES